jgi:hypothetical protein
MSIHLLIWAAVLLATTHPCAAQVAPHPRVELHSLSLHPYGGRRGIPRVWTNGPPEPASRLVTTSFQGTAHDMQDRLVPHLSSAMATRSTSDSPPSTGPRPGSWDPPAAQTNESTQSAHLRASPPSNQTQSIGDLIDAAYDTAVRIVNHSCAMMAREMSTRLAPFKYAQIGSAIMQTQAVFVLQPGRDYSSGLDEVWVPLSLAVQRNWDDVATRDMLLGLAEYDMYITVNPDVRLAFGDSDCGWVATPHSGTYFSATSVLLHELLHGMGIYSLIQASSPDAFHNKVSVFDAHMTQGILDQRVFMTQSDIDNTTASVLAGDQVRVGRHLLYNPTEYRPGSSLSHFIGDTLMAATAKPGQCRFSMSSIELSALNTIGWNCTAAPGSHAWDRNGNVFLDHIGSQGSTHNGASGPTQHRNNPCAHGLCRSSYLGVCIECNAVSTADAAILVLFVALFVLLGVLLAGMWCASDTSILQPSVAWQDWSGPPLFSSPHPAHRFAPVQSHARRNCRTPPATKVVVFPPIRVV